MGLQKKLILGNLDSKRDWGYAKEYVEAMWLMLQQDQPDDYVIATNETHTVREFLEETFAHLDMDWKQYVGFDKKYERPAEVDLLIGDPSKAKSNLGWEPKTTFKELVALMVDDMKLAEREKTLQKRIFLRGEKNICKWTSWNGWFCNSSSLGTRLWGMANHYQRSEGFGSL